MLQGFGLLHATAASQNMDTFRQALFRQIPCQQSLLYYNNGGFAGNISGSFLGISCYEYFTDVTTGREKIVTEYNFK
jgi:hypothetical protein